MYMVHSTKTAPLDRSEPLSERKRELLDQCLDKFLEKGLYKTSIKDLSEAVNLQQGALYFHFTNKDEIVLACAEEAGKRLEDKLLIPTIECFGNQESWLEQVSAWAEEYAPMMRFFTQVFTAAAYRDKVQPIMERMKARHIHHAEKLASRLHCAPKEIEPYLYLCVALFANYMIFDEKMYFEQPIEIMRNALQTFQKGTMQGDLPEPAVGKAPGQP